MIVHLNGQLVDRSAARVDPFDRGFLLGEGIYEGLRAIAWPSARAGTRIVGLSLHIRRLQNGVGAAGIEFDASHLGAMSEELLQANGLRDAFVYWQVTGGAPGEGAPARSRFRQAGQRPSVFGFCEPKPGLGELRQPRELSVVTCRDVRWELGHVKSISLMGNIWCARQAQAAGADEAILIRGGSDGGAGGVVSEGLATNVVLVLPDGRGGEELVTPALTSAPMLEGVTRSLVLRWAPEIRERVVRAEELAHATEIMLVGTTTYISAVVRVDGRVIGEGRSGARARRLHTMLLDGYLAGRDIAGSEAAGSGVGVGADARASASYPRA